VTVPTAPTEEELFAEFPQWRALARTEVAEDGSSFVVVEVAAPSAANVEHGLVVDTAREEITVGFDCYHTHFDEWVGDGQHFGTQAAVEFIKQIMSERVSVVSWWFNEQWRGSSQLEAGATPEPPSWAGAESYNRIRVRSWNGKFNASIDA
jgi:hypothetical protein